MPWVHITSISNTWLKRRPEPLEELDSKDKAQVLSSRTINRCQILERTKDHSYLELGFGLGDWWVVNKDWKGLDGEVTKPKEKSLSKFPYFHRVMDDEGWEQSQSASIAMCLKYCNTPNINSHNNYLSILNKYGKAPSRYANTKALRELDTDVTFSLSSDDVDVKKIVDKGLPAVVGLLVRGPLSKPVGVPHYVAITGYGSNYWIAQDPFGCLDLINGLWLHKEPNSGKNVHYDFTNFNRRFMNEGGASGRVWSNFCII